MCAGVHGSCADDDCLLVSALCSDKCSAILEVHTASIFRVTELVTLDDQVM